jgi:hypothetical protein
VLCFLACPGIKSTVTSPIFQAGLKYALVLIIIFIATILAIYFHPILAELNPAYGFVASALAMSERVEATVSKASICHVTVIRIGLNNTSSCALHGCQVLIAMS